MALYRNIAGAHLQNGNGRVGLSISELLKPGFDLDQFFNPTPEVYYDPGVPDPPPPQPPSSSDAVLLSDYLSTSGLPTTTNPFFPSTSENALPTGVPSTAPNNSTTTSTPVVPDVKTALTSNILPLLALAGLVVVAIKGDDLLHKKRKLVFVAGLGVLYYAIAKKQPV